MTRTYPWLVSLALILGAGLPANTALLAGPVVDPADDLRQFDPNDPSSYAGPANPGLDVLSANVIFDLSRNTLTFTSTMAGPISGLVDPSTGANLGSFSWGINHGYGNLNFAAIGLPDVLFDAVLALNPNGTAAYRGAQAPAGSVTASGNTLTAVLPISFLAPPPPPANAQGPLLPVAEWSYNLWPRSLIRADGTPLGFGDAQIADFAPDATDFLAQAVPEPGTLGTGALGAGLAFLSGAWKRSRPETGRGYSKGSGVRGFRLRNTCLAAIRAKAVTPTRTPGTRSITAHFQARSQGEAPGAQVSGMAGGAASR